MHARISKPRLKSRQIHSRNCKILETHKRKLPEERRKLLLFPKSSKKFVVTQIRHKKLEVTEKPFILITKKPLMRKIVLQNKIINKSKMALEQETKRPIMEIKFLKENNLDTPQKAEPYFNSEEISSEFVEDKSYEMRKDKIQKGDKEQDTAASYNTYKDPLLINDVTSIPKEKPVEVIPEKREQQPSIETSSATNNYDQSEIADQKEFIFINSLKKTTERDRVSSEESEEFVTTETPIKIKLERMER